MLQGAGPAGVRGRPAARRCGWCASRPSWASRPTPETERLTAAAAPRLTEPSPERVFAELRRLIVARGCLSGLELAARLGVLDAVLPELTALEGVEQSRFHHLDVLRPHARGAARG